MSLARSQARVSQRPSRLLSTPTSTSPSTRNIATIHTPTSRRSIELLVASLPASLATSTLLRPALFTGHTAVVIAAGLLNATLATAETSLVTRPLLLINITSECSSWALLTPIIGLNTLLTSLNTTLTSLNTTLNTPLTSLNTPLTSLNTPLISLNTTLTSLRIRTVSKEHVAQISCDAGPSNADSTLPGFGFGL